MFDRRYYSGELKTFSVHLKPVNWWKQLTIQHELITAIAGLNNDDDCYYDKMTMILDDDGGWYEDNRHDLGD